MGKDSRTLIHLPGEGRSIDMGAFRMTVKADACDTGGSFTVLEADEPPGFGPPMHIHEDASEAFFVIAGEYVIFVEDDEFVCPAGSFIYIPTGVRHGFRVGPVSSRKLNIFIPGAMVGYFDEMAAANGSGSPLSATDLSEMAARHSMQVLGPVPEGYL